LFFIAPGFVYSRAYWTARPRYYKEQSPFDQVVTTVTASALINIALLSAMAAAVLVYQGVAAARGLPFELPPANTILKPPLDYPSTTLAGLTLLAALYLTSSLLIARYAGRYLGLRSLESLLLWYRVLVEEKTTDPVWLTARLQNGEEYTGALRHIVWVGDKDNTVELGLEKIAYRRHTAADKEKEKAEERKQEQAEIVEKEQEQSEILVLPDRLLVLRSKDILWLSRIDLPAQRVSP